MTDSTVVTLRADAEYARWLHRNATTTALIYSGLIGVLLPAFHYILVLVPGVPPGSDSMPLRLGPAALAAAIAAVLAFFPQSRRHAMTMQFYNVLVCLTAIGMLVVNSGNHYAYVAAAMLVIIGAQHAFYRTIDLIGAFGLGWVLQVIYSAIHTDFWAASNIATLLTFASAYAIALIPAALRIRVQDSEIRNRLDAQHAKEALQEVQAITQLGNWTCDLRSGAVAWSEQLRTIFELPPGLADVDGLYVKSIHPDDRPIYDGRVSAARASGESFTLDHRVITHGGTVRWVELHGKFEYDSAGAPVRWVAAVLDISARKRAEDALSLLARYDALTGLPNRTSLLDYVAREITRSALEGTECAVAFIDLDRFKDVNDTLGHVLGDHVLRDVARRISRVLGGAGLLGRWGGDEFVAVLPAVARRSDVEELARSVIEAVAQPFRVDEVDLAISSSIGVAFYPEHGGDAEELIRNADAAMYQAKHEFGSGCAVFSETLHDEVATRHHVQQELRRALSEDGLALYYQPIVEAAGGRIVAAEALVRWIDAEGTVHQPGEFIDIAEESRIIIPLGAWVLDAACAQAAAWRRSGLHLRVAINVSPRQFAHPDFAHTLALALQRSGAEPEDIEIEITEAAIMSTAEPVLSTLDAVHRMGIAIAIDDFGTGYSSFAYLKRFKVDSLKIDRTFVEGIERDDNLAIARSIVSVAHALGLPVTAEGVETPLQRELLERLGCDRLQGYLFGRPQPRGDFEDQLRTVVAAGS